MSKKMATLVYENQEQQVSWQGYDLPDNDAFDSFITKDVAARLNDEEGSIEFESHLRGLSLTGFGKSSLEAVLDAKIPEERDWAVGEAFAEAWLSQEHGVIWPWNMERDKRNANASLPGADYWLCICLVKLRNFLKELMEVPHHESLAIGQYRRLPS